jgi:hypothetical protein
MDIFLIVLGLVFLIASMAFILNPPEAWIKKVFLKSQSNQQSTRKKDDSQTQADNGKTPQP